MVIPAVQLFLKIKFVDHTTKIISSIANNSKHRNL